MSSCNNRKLNYVRLYGNEVNLSEIGPSYCYTAHTMHCKWGKKPKIVPSSWDCVTPPEEDRATAVGNMHKNLVTIVVWFGRGDMLADRQTDTRTHRR